MDGTRIIEVPIEGMDCAECTTHVHQAIASLPGVDSVEVFLASEKAIVQLDAQQVQLADIQNAVSKAGYAVPQQPEAPPAASPREFTHSILTLLGLVFGAVLFVVVVGEWLGLFETISARIPWPLGLALILVGGYPVFVNVVKAALRRQVIAHTLMTVGVIAALSVGEWATAAVVVFFMRVGDYAERFTTERARKSVRELTTLSPQKARLLREGVEIEVPISEVHPGDTVVVRPGEMIPVDGQVISGQATINQATITGESLPVEAAPGSRVFAATIAQLGGLLVSATHIGADTTFGQVIKLVEEAEAHRADVQRLADKFSAYYLPVVGGLAALTFLIRHDPLATAAVLVVACSCAFALATPIAMLASIGASARRGLMIKGGKYLELLARADVLLVDKTGTLTKGEPTITDILISDQVSEINGTDHWSQVADNRSLDTDYLLKISASAEKYSEHPLAEAVRAAARARGLELVEPQEFESLPGLGVRARINGKSVTVGNLRMGANGDDYPQADKLEAQGKSLLYVAIDGQPAGLLAAADTLRPEVISAISAVREMGIDKIELLTGDNPRTAANLADQLGVTYQAELLPEEKIAIVKAYQSEGHTVIMVGDGVNDAPALAQADVGIAMGAAGSDIAIEAAHVALMRDDWMLIPQVFAIARRTMRVVKTNIAFTAVYNLAGLSLAALGFLPPILAAAAQSLPDLGILANSSRLLRQK